jgi:hypothetical protein
MRLSPACTVWYEKYPRVPTRFRLLGVQHFYASVQRLLYLGMSTLNLALRGQKTCQKWSHNGRHLVLKATHRRDRYHLYQCIER